MLTDPGPVRRYIEDRSDSELADWDILFTSVSKQDPETLDSSLGIPINRQRRTAGDKSDSTTIRVTNKQRVSSRGVEKTGLTAVEIEQVETDYRNTEYKGKEDGKPINYPDRIYRTARKRPLLIVHLLKIDTKADKPPVKEVVVAWSISFPATNIPEKRVEYVVNTTWLRENYRDESEEDEMEGDNE
jgi:hypothetical protein